jgi:hypothetical protein
MFLNGEWPTRTGWRGGSRPTMAGRCGAGGVLQGDGWVDRAVFVRGGAVGVLRGRGLSGPAMLWRGAQGQITNPAGCQARADLSEDVWVSVWQAFGVG